MAQIQNPYSQQPYEVVYTDKHNNPTHGERTVDGLKEIVDLKTGKSNMTYLTPEKVTNYDSCSHEFSVLNMGARELECDKCHYQMTFHVTGNYLEENGKGFVLINKKKYPVI